MNTRQPHSGQNNPKSGAFTGNRVHEHFTAMLLDHFIGGHQSQAVTAETFGGIDGIKYRITHSGLDYWVEMMESEGYW